MLIALLAHHAKQAPLLRTRLGDGHEMAAVERLPADGEFRADVVIGSRVPAEEARRLRVRLLQVPGAGLDGIALDALPPGVAVCNVFEHEIPIAEYVIHAVLEHCIQPDGPTPPLDAATWAGAFNGRRFHGEAAGRTMALVGFGHIGRTIAARARALGMRIVAVSRRGLPDAAADYALPVSRLREALPEADVLVLCCPLDDTTRGLVGAAELAAMKPSALLVNVARAEVAEEQALFEALRDRRIAGAALDVWYRYPKPGEGGCAPSRFPFHDLPNVRGTPHISGWTDGLMERRYAFIAENIRRLGAGEPLENVVRPAG